MTENGQALAVQDAPGAVASWSSDTVDLLRRTLARDAMPDEFDLFLAVCKRTGLDPWAKQIYSISRWSKAANRKVATIQVSIDGLRLIAARSGQYAGQAGPLWCGQDGKWRDVWLEKEPPAACKVGIRKKGVQEPTWSTCLWESYVQDTPLWRTMGPEMLAKCCESLSLRKMFPAELAGFQTVAPEVELDTSDAEAAALEEWEALQAAQSQPNPAPAPASAAFARHASPPEPPKPASADAQEPAEGEYREAGLPAVESDTRPALEIFGGDPNHEAEEVAALFAETPLRGESKSLWLRMQGMLAFKAVKLPLDTAPESEWSSWLTVWGEKVAEADRANARRAQTASRPGR